MSIQIYSKVFLFTYSFGKSTISYLVFIAFLLGIVFLVLQDDTLEKELRSSYLKAKMQLKKVYFNELDQGIEYAKVFADLVEMDDFMNNMVATNVKVIYIDKNNASKTGYLVASYASKSPLEAKFWGDVRVFTTEEERLRTEELRYYFSSREIFTNMPVTIWKDNMIITGQDLRYNLNTKTGLLGRNVVIKIWDSKVKNKKTQSKNLADELVINSNNPSKSAGSTTPTN